MLYEDFIQKQSDIVWHNSEDLNSYDAKRWFTAPDEGYYHFDDELGPNGRLLNHEETDVNSQYMHLQIHSPDGSITRINWGNKIW